MYRQVAIELSTPCHARLLSKCLRKQDEAEVRSAGITPARGVWRSFKRSILPAKTAFVDNEIAAMWGLGGNLLSDIGVPWILTAPAIEKVPLALVKESRKDIAEWLGFRRRLENYVAADYAQAIRFWGMMGFQFGEPEPVGPQGQMFRKFWIER
jgi:hypothetical protein